MAGFEEMANAFGQIDEDSKKKFKHVHLIVNALKMPVKNCDQHYNGCIYNGTESNIFGENLLKNQVKFRYPRQSEGPYYPVDRKEDVNNTAKLVRDDQDYENEEEKNDGFTSKIKGYYDKVKSTIVFRKL